MVIGLGLVLAVVVTVVIILARRDK